MIIVLESNYSKYMHACMYDYCSHTGTIIAVPCQLLKLQHCANYLVHSISGKGYCLSNPTNLTPQLVARAIIYQALLTV